MSRWRPRALPVAAVLLMITGLGLMVASLRIETSRVQAGTTVADVPAVATPIAVVGTPAASEDRATRLFARAQQAHRTIAYDGVKVVTRWDRGTSSSVVLTVDHLPGSGTYVAAGDAGDAGAASDGAAAAARTFTAASAPGDEAAMLRALVSNYRLVSAGQAELLDRPADKVEARRADDTVAACFWIDRATGLVLRRELFDAQGGTLESASFVRVDVDADDAPSSAAPRVGSPTNPSAVPTPSVWPPVDQQGVDRLRDRAWVIPDRMDGGLTLYQVREQQDADGTVVQLGYTDGLVAISVFVQDGALDRTALEGYLPVDVLGGEVWARGGGTPFYVWQSTVAGSAAATSSSGTAQERAIVVSATTDSPSAPVAAVVAAFPAVAPTGDGVGDRVARGIQRISGWLDPLG